MRAFFRDGAVHVVRTVPAPVIGTLRAASERRFREWDELAAGGSLPDELAAAHERRYVPLRTLPGFEAMDALLHPTVRALARAYLGAEPEIDPNSHVRAVAPRRADAHLPFHQDETILKHRLVNVWIALDACGRTAPGLEVVRGSWRALLEPTPPTEPRFPVERARLDANTVLDTFAAGAFWHPEFEAGDAMLFSGATIHRTYCTPGMTSNRASAELRLS